MLIKINNIVRVGNSIIKNTIFRSRRQTNRDVIVFTTEAIGDNLLFLDTFREFENLAQKKERELVLICGEKMQGFWVSNSCSDKTTIIAVDLCEFKTFSGRKLNDLLKKINSMCCDNVVVPMHHTASLMIGAMVKASTYLTIVYDEWLVNRPSIVNRLYRSVYKNGIYAEKDLFIGKAFGKLMKYFEDSYKWSIGYINCQKGDRLISENYILVAPIASCIDKSLSEIQIMRIIEFLLKNTKQIIVLTATADHYTYFEEIVEKYKHSRLMNWAGKTNFEQYIQLVNDARFLIGCDSGSIHMAASLNTPSIALCGQWSGAYLPYSGEGTFSNAPRCFWRNQNELCQFCLSNQGGISSVNQECYERVLRGGNRSCLEEVVLENVFNEVISIIEDEDRNDGFK